MKLYVWYIDDTVYEQGIAFALAPTKEAAIKAICEKANEEDSEALNLELQENEPDIATSELHAELFVSST